MLTYAAQIRGLLADYDTPTGLIWEMWDGFLAYLNDRQVPWGIVTNGSRIQHRKCRAAGLDQLAPFVIVSEEAGYAKPDPRIFRDAMKATELTSPEQIMFIGDNPIADIDAFGP